MIEDLKLRLTVFIQRTEAQVIFLLGIWALAVGSRFYVNGDSFGFDYSVFQPDGVLYALRTYMFMGENQVVAARLIEDWYFTNGASGNHFDPSSILPGNTPAWGLVAPRVLYPILSVPFLAMFGMNGLLVIPSLSLLTLVLCIYFTSKKFEAQNFGVVLSLAVLISPTVLRWMVANITDSLFVGLFALVCLTLESGRSRFNNYLSIGLLIVLTNLTRFATPIWLAIAFVDFFTGRRKRAAYISLVALLATIPTYLTQPSNSVLPREGNLSFIEKILALPKSFLKIAFFEIAQLAVLDRLLLLILAIAVILSVGSLKNETNFRFIMILIATWSIGALNGSIGVNFRYQLPVLPFACAVLLANLKPLGDWFFRRIGNVKGKEAKQ